jgi:hypothetical protein
VLVVLGKKSERPGLEGGAVLREKATQCLVEGDVQRGHDGECDAVADLSLEPERLR